VPDDTAAVADELRLEQVFARRGEELGKLELLEHAIRFVPGFGAGIHVVLEGEKDYESEEDREGGADEAKNTGGAVGVGEEATSGRPLSDEKEGGEARDDRDDDYEPGEAEAHKPGRPTVEADKVKVRTLGQPRP